MGHVRMTRPPPPPPPTMGKTKDGLIEIAKEIVELLKTKNLPIWQAKEVLGFTIAQIDYTLLN